MSADDHSDGRAEEGADDASSLSGAPARAELAAMEEVAAEPACDVQQLDPLGAEIERMRKEQLELKGKRQKLTRDLRNAQRKKKRLNDRARKLSDKDLLAVLMMRKNQREKSAAGENDAGAGRANLSEKAASSKSSRASEA